MGDGQRGRQHSGPRPQHDPREYPQLLEPAIAGKADVVYGSRFVGGDSHRVLFFWHSVGNKLEQGFFDDLESAQVAMINTHGGPLWSHRIGRETFQIMRNYDEWVTLHEPGDDALGTGLLRHLFLETCSGINWRNNFKGDIKNLVVDWMSPGVADGLRTAVTALGDDAGG